MPGVQRFFSKSVPPETLAGRTPGMGSARAPQLILVIPTDGIADVENRGREAALVLADLPSVQPYGGAELRLVDFEHHRPSPRRDKGLRYQK